MLSLIITIALSTSPRSEVVTVDRIEVNAYNVAAHRFIEQAPVQVIYWQNGRVLHWRMECDSVRMRDGEGCTEILNAGGKLITVRALQYGETWSYGDPEVEDRWLHGGNGYTTRWRRLPQDW